MDNYLDIVKGKYFAISSTNETAVGKLFSICPVNIDSGHAEFAYAICHPILGNLLEFGWARSAKTDTPSIRVALVYCAYAGLAAKHCEDSRIECTPQGLFNQIAKQDGLLRWCENAQQVIGLDAPSDVAKQISSYFEQCHDSAAAGLPEVVIDENSEINCLDACVAMFFIGKSIAITKDSDENAGSSPF